MQFPKLFNADEIDGINEAPNESLQSKPMVHSVAPDYLLNDLQDYQRIADIIRKDWGTIELKKFLDELLRDTRDHTRQGFPFKASSALIRLSLANTEFLESQGFNFVDPLKGSDFMGTDLTRGWKIPKHF
jgi:hypothetical protein